MSSDEHATRVELAHAKINLVLHILAREVSGYHGIETLFQKLALHDVVTVRVGNSERSLDCFGPTMPLGGLGVVEENLAWRAAELYAREANWATGWDISVEKRIPVGGGLGGGSADAAAVLRAMESLCPTPVGTPRLLAMAGTLGADVPFLVTPASRAWAWSRGDRLLTLPPIESVPVMLFVFDEGVNTSAAYRAFAALRDSSAEMLGAHVYDPSAFDSWERIAQCAHNDFERVVPAMHSGVREALVAIRESAARFRTHHSPVIGMMSGSGATCFQIVLAPPRNDDGLADELLFTRSGPWQTLLTHTI